MEREEKMVTVILTFKNTSDDEYNATLSYINPNATAEEIKAVANLLAEMTTSELVTISKRETTTIT